MIDVTKVIACQLIVVSVLVQPLHATGDGESKHMDNDVAAKSGDENLVNIEKRAAGPRQYSFGLGKRDSEAMLDENELEDDQEPFEKRQQAQRFSFGLGKRASDYRPNGYSRFNFGLGKRDLSDEEDAYSLSKKAMQRYQFGLGKKSAPSRYAFGLGKRQQFVPRQFEDLFKRRYNFGLGK